MLELDIRQLSSKQDTMTDIKMEIPNGSYIGITGEGRSRFMYALIGKADLIGDIVLDEISIKNNYHEYIKQVAYISEVTRKRLNGSKLTINEFLDLSVMLRMDNIDIDTYEKKKTEYLDFFGINGKEKLINLKEEELLLLEFVTLFLKEPKLILIDDFFSLLSEENIDKMMKFLKKYLYPDNISVIASKYEKFLRRITNHIYILK